MGGGGRDSVDKQDLKRTAAVALNIFAAVDDHGPLTKPPRKDWPMRLIWWRDDVEHHGPSCREAVSLLLFE